MAKLKFLSIFGFVLAGVAVTAFALTGWPPSLPGGAGGPQMQGLSWVSFDVSPDEKTIVFSGAGKGGLSLYLLDLATSRITCLVDTSSYENYPAFSPDGKSIVYQSAEDLSAPRYLFLRSLDGKHVRQLTNTPATSDDHPSFSPDGKRIVFARSQYFHDGTRGENTWSDIDVFLINSDGSSLRQLTHFHSQAVIAPKFCTDNQHILCDSAPISGLNSATGLPQMAIERLDTAGHYPGQEVVHFGTYGDASPYPTPDGKGLVFSVISRETWTCIALLCLGVPPRLF